VSATPDLGAFFAPASVALVGATEDPSRFGGRCLHRILHFGFPGRVYPVNPAFRELRGLACFPSVREVPEAPDHVGIAVPAERVMGVLEDCAARGARFATVFSGGFAETATAEGRALQASLRDFARTTGMRIMGPNCNGLVNFVGGFALTSSGSVAGPRQSAGDVGIVSQSGGLGQVNVMWRAQEAGVGVSYEVSCGNCADLDAFDFVRFMIDDATTRVILMVMEQLGDGRRMLELARHAAEREKPIVILKVGRTAAGSRAAASHTGAVTGEDAVQDAAFRQCGMIRVDDCNELYEVAMLLRTGRWPRGRRAAALTISGGNGVLIVDHGSALGIDWPQYAPATVEKLRACLPAHGTTTNPTDITNAAIGRRGIYRRVIEAIAADESVDVIVPMLTLAAASDVREVAQAATEAEKPVAVLWTGGCNDERTLGARDLIATGVPVFRNTLGCLKAVRAAMRYGVFLAALRRGDPAAAPPAGFDLASARARLGDSVGTLTERASKHVLAACGIPVTRERLAHDADEAVRHARESGGPVALKIESAQIPHKTEAGAILLDVEGEAAVRTGFRHVMDAARRYAPEAVLDGVLVQAMAPRGLEMILGVVNDATFGPVVMAGLGGIHVEVLRDVAYRVAPIGREDAEAMLSELRGERLLDGVRGMAARDREAICDLIVRLSWLAWTLRDRIAEIDVNPLIVFERGQGAVAVDALVVARGA